MNNKLITRAALLLSVAVVAQGLRLVLPAPGLATMFIIGAIVNMCLMLTVFYCAPKYAAVSSLLLPVIAYMQGQLPIIPMIAVVFFGNLILVVVATKVQGVKLLLIGPFLKALTLWSATGLVCQLLHVPAGLTGLLRVMMGIPQFITALIGVGLALAVYKRFRYL